MEVMVPDDIRTKAVAGAQAVYRLSEAANFDPALAFSLRRKATEALTAVAALGVLTLDRRSERARELLAAVLGVSELIGLARELGQIAPENAGRVLAAYAAIAEWARPLAGGGAEPGGVVLSAADEFTGELNERQQRIVAFVAANGRTSATALRQLFGEAVSTKTLRRDLWGLIDAGLLFRIGDNRWTMYVARRKSKAET